MSAEPLPNYLRTFRRRAGLSQNDLAALLGYRDGSIVSRLESSARLPPARILLAYGVIFDAPLSKLLSGHYRRTRGLVALRARALAARSRRRRSAASRRKAAFLRRLAETK